MAKKKAKTSRPKRRKSPMGDRRTTTKRRAKRGRKKGLSDIVSHAGAKRGLKSTFVGAGGGLTAKGIDMVTGDSELLKGGVSLVAAFIAGAMDCPNLSAGIAGGYAYGLGDRLEKKYLSDDWSEADYADQDSMSDYPDALTEGGGALYLAEDGQLYLADDFFKQPDGTFVLADNANPYNSSMAMANY